MTTAAIVLMKLTVLATAATVSFGAKTADVVSLRIGCVTMKTIVAIIQMNETVLATATTVSFGAVKADSAFFRLGSVTEMTTVAIIQTSETAPPVATASFGATTRNVFLKASVATVTTTAKTI